MKQLFHLSQISKKAIIVTSCFFLFPSSLLSAQAQTKVTSLAQAKTSESSSKADLETAIAKKLATYILEFNRSPIVGNRMRLRGVYSEGRLAFTRPRGWKLDRGKVQALIRFQHSPALYANRSNLTVLVNGVSVGSVPLNRKDSQVGQVLFNIPPIQVRCSLEPALVGY